jgi:S1-C subfamily serine protease
MTLLTDLSRDVATLAEQVAPRVIAVRRASGRQSSGFVWRTGLAVTAEEALEGDDEAEALVGGSGKPVKATLVGRDPSTDVGLLKLDTGDFGDWTNATAVRAASFALLAGRDEQSLVASLTSLSEVGSAWRSLRGGQIDARLSLALRLSSRTEGAAVVAPDGGLIGMAVSSPRRRALVIPALTIGRSIATLLERGYIPRGWIGVMLHPVGSGAGTIVLGLEAESPAAKAGLLVGDVITTWNGETLNSIGDLAGRLASSAVGSKARLGVIRGGQSSDVEVTVGERPRN